MAHNPCAATQAVAFVSKYQTDADRLAKQIGVLAENILGLAAHESQYGKGRFAMEGNNFFSMHAPAPYQSGVLAAKGNAKVMVATYSSFYDAGLSFLARFGNAVRGKTDPREFANALWLVTLIPGTPRQVGATATRSM